MTVEPISGKGQRFFTAERLETEREVVQRVANEKKTVAGNLRNKAAEHRGEANQFDNDASKLLKEAADLEEKIDAGEFDGKEP